MNGKIIGTCQIVVLTVDFSYVRTFRWKCMVCMCHMFGLFPMARTNHILPMECSNATVQTKSFHLSTITL